MSITTAKKCFRENRNLFGDTKTQSEKFNLYNGLYALADAIEDLERKINALEHLVRSLR